MAAPDPLVLLVPEDSPESWDSLDPRELLYVAPLSPLGLNSRLRSNVVVCVTTCGLCCFLRLQGEGGKPGERGVMGPTGATVRIPHAFDFLNLEESSLNL